MKKIFFISIILLMASAAYGQDNVPKNTANSVGKSGWIKKGYRGFLEVGGGGDVKDSKGSFSINTTHGRQFSRCFFMGGGIGYTRTTTKAYYKVPDDPKKYYYTDPHDIFYTYMDMRFTVPTRSRYYPFADFKFGLGGETSVYYVNCQAGVRYGLNRILGLSLSVYCTILEKDAAAGPIMGVTAGFDF